MLNLLWSEPVWLAVAWRVAPSFAGISCPGRRCFRVWTRGRAGGWRGSSSRTGFIWWRCVVVRSRKGLGWISGSLMTKRPQHWMGSDVDKARKAPTPSSSLSKVWSRVGYDAHILSRRSLIRRWSVEGGKLGWTPWKWKDVPSSRFRNSGVEGHPSGLRLNYTQGRRQVPSIDWAHVDDACFPCRGASDRNSMEYGEDWVWSPRRGWAWRCRQVSPNARIYCCSHALFPKNGVVSRCILPIPGSPYPRCCVPGGFPHTNRHFMFLLVFCVYLFIYFACVLSEFLWIFQLSRTFTDFYGIRCRFFWLLLGVQLFSSFFPFLLWVCLGRPRSWSQRTRPHVQ